MQKEVNEDSKKPQQEYVPSTNQKANSKQINRLLNESSASNTYRNSKLNANNKYNSPTQNSSSHKPKSQNVIMQNAQNLSQQQKNESEGGANNNIDEQNIIKVNNKVRTIFRGGIIGMMQGKAKKKKTQFSRDNLNSKQKEEQNKLQSLFFSLEQLSRAERIQKATRHFQDAINFKPVRHDIELHENRLIPFIYFWQTSSVWQLLMQLVAFIYPMCSFIEPPNRHVTDYIDNSMLLITETIIQGFIWIDVILEIIHRYFDKDRDLYQHYLQNYKFSTKILIAVILLLDLIIFHSYFPILTYRFSRYVRPSIIGWRFIGDLDNQVEFDRQSSNFSNLFTAASNLYSLISFDSYPTIMIPSYKYKIFYEFMGLLYLKKKRYLKKIKQLHNNLDQNQTQSLSLNEFFEIIDYLEKNPRFQIPRFKDQKSWETFRKKMNETFHVKKIVRSTIFEVVMISILIINCVILFISMTINDQGIQDTMDMIDDYFFYAYLIEFILKIIGNGIEKYFEDSWNCFDFFMVVMSFFNIVLSTTLSFLQNAKSAKATKLLRLTKINRVFRIFKALRSIKFLSILLAGFELFYQVKELLIKIFMCLPIVIRLIPVILVVYYIYTYVGLENFNTNTFEYAQGSPYDQNYVDFNNFYSAMLIYFQIMVEANWSQYIYDIAYKFGIPLEANILFISYDFIQNFILLSLVKGIVWEVFTVVNLELKEIEMKNELLAIQSQNQDKLGQNKFIELDQNDKENLLNQENHQSNGFLKTHNFLKEVNDQNENNNKNEAVNQKIPSDLKGIFLYEKVLRNLKLLSLNNSFIYNEGQIPDSPKLTQQNNKNHTEESNNEKEIINERISSESRNIIYSTKQVKTSPQKTKNYLLDKLYVKEENFSVLKNPPVSIENLDKNFSTQVSNTNKKLSTQKRRRNSDSLFDMQSQIVLKNITEAKKKNTSNNSNQLIQNRLYKPDKSQCLTESEDECIDLNTENHKDKESKSKNISFDDLTLRKQQKDNQNDEQNENHFEKLIGKQKTKQESESCFSKNVSFALVNKTLGDRSFLDRQDSSISQFPLKNESMMKSQIEGPFMLSEAPEPIAPQKSYTNFNSLTQHDITQENQFEEEDVNKITNEQVYWMKKKIKALNYLKKIQLNRKKEKSSDQKKEKSDIRKESQDQKKEKPIDLNEFYIISDDEETIKAYQKQVNDYIQEEDQDFTLSSDQIDKDDANQSLNYQYMMKKALLSDSNIDMIKKLEIDYFQHTYGSYFNAFHEVKISPILKYESYIIYNLQRILRHKALDCIFFFSVLKNFEKNLSNILLRKGSLVKFVFQDSYGNWICFKEMNGNMFPCLLGKGPWAFYEKVFTKDDIYISRDFFQINQNQQLQNLVHKSYEQMRVCARCLDTDHPFLNINPEKSIFDFFTICSQNTNEDEVVSLTSQFNRKSYPHVPTTVQIYCKKVMMIVMSYVGESDDQLQNQEQDIEQDKNKKQGIFSNIFNQIEPEKARKKAKQNPKNINLNDIKQKQTQDKDRINEQSTLPMGFLVEMMQSIQDLINLYQVNLHLKVSEVINQKIYSKNYLNQIIQENNNIVEEVNENMKKKMKKEQKKKKGLFKLFKKDNI